jgi:hypothetical protein
MQYHKLDSQYYLIKTCTEPNNNIKVDNIITNHIWLYDRSASMSSSIKDLCKEMKRLVRTIPLNNTITLCWFSGEGQKGTIVKGFKLTSDNDFTIVDKAIDNNSSTLSTTCFSESLIELSNILEDLSCFSDNYQFSLWTDGYPICSNMKKELENINKALNNIKYKNVSSLLVGYGNYYNKELLLNMANIIGGTLLHVNELIEWGVSMTNFIKNSDINKTKIKLSLPIECVKNIFSINNQNITNYIIEENINIIGNVYYMITTEPFGIENTQFDYSSIYASALIFVQQLQTDIALKILNTIGDKYLIDLTNNTYTLYEYGKLEYSLLNAMNDEKYQFIEGKIENYLPDDNCLCLLELLDMLVNDDDACFFPNHPDFKYNRVGIKKIQNLNYPKFEPKDTKVFFNKLTWHDSKLNLSVLTTIDGKIKLSSPLHGQEYYDTFIYRNFTIIKDGILNVKTLPVRFGCNLHNYIRNLYCHIILNQNTTDGIYIIDLTKLPIVNRAICQCSTSAKLLSHDIIKKLQLECHMKVFKSRLKIIEENKYISRDLKFLEQHGIRKDGSYSPPVIVDNNIEKDYYMAKAFNIKIKGASSLPKVEDLNKLKLTLPGQFMKEATYISDDQINEEFIKTKKELNNIVTNIQKYKFSLILCKKWFDDFKTRKDNELEYKQLVGTVNVDTTITFSIDEIKVVYD